MVEERIAEWSLPVKEEIKRKPKDRAKRESVKPISLKEALKNPPISFFSKRKNIPPEKKKKAEPKIDELREILDKAIQEKENKQKKKEEDIKEDGIIKPGDKISFK